MSLIIALFAAALLFLFLEIFLPGGLLAILGGLMIVGASFVTAQEYGLFAGIGAFFIGALVAVLLFFIEVKVLANSAWGKHIRLNNQVEGASLQEPEVDDLIGSVAIAVTPLNPSGRIKIGTRIMTAKLDSGWAASGSELEIVGSDLYHVRVRLIAQS
jgi:membrane-bound ClpP family serine protease